MPAMFEEFTGQVRRTRAQASAPRTVLVYPVSHPIVREPNKSCPEEKSRMNRTITRSMIGAVGVMVLGWAAAPTVSSQAPAAASSQAGPLQQTRDEDFERTRALLGISGPPPAGAVNGRPETFDESQANPYPTLPDPLTLNSGQNVTTAAYVEHAAPRRTARALRARNLRPHAEGTPRVKWEVISTTREMNGDVPVITKELRGTRRQLGVSRARRSISKPSLSTPADATGPVPVILSSRRRRFGFGRGRGDAAGPAAAGDDDLRHRAGARGRSGRRRRRRRQPPARRCRRGWRRGRAWRRSGARWRRPRTRRRRATARRPTSSRPSRSAGATPASTPVASRPTTVRD